MPIRRIAPRGFGLVQVLVTLSLLTTATLYFLQSFLNIKKGERHINQQALARQVFQEMQLFLSSKELCEKTLLQTDVIFNPTLPTFALSPILRRPGSTEVLLQNNMEIQNQLAVDSLMLGSFTLISGSLYTGKLDLVFKKLGMSAMNVGSSEFRRSMTLLLDTIDNGGGNRKIISCQSQAETVAINNIVSGFIAPGAAGIVTDSDDKLNAFPSFNYTAKGTRIQLTTDTQMRCQDFDQFAYLHLRIHDNTTNTDLPGYGIPVTYNSGFILMFHSGTDTNDTFSSLSRTILVDVSPGHSYTFTYYFWAKCLGGGNHCDNNSARIVGDRVNYILHDFSH